MLKRICTVFILTFLCACNSLQQKNYTIQISNNSSCIYRFDIKSSTVEFYSYFYYDDNGKKVYDTLNQIIKINDSERAIIEQEINKIINDDSIVISTYTRPDMYTFSLYESQNLLRKKWGGDSCFNNMLRVVIPYVEKEKMQCDEFLVLFEKAVMGR